MKSIWKFPLETSDEQEVTMPAGSQILCVQMQGQMMCLWAKVDQYTTERERRHILIRGTGHRLDGNEGLYIGTVQMQGGALVWHVFEEAP